MRQIVLILPRVRKHDSQGFRVMHTFAAEKPSIPFSSAVFSYPTGESSLYGPAFAFSLTVVGSTARFGSVMVSVAEGAMMEINMRFT